MIGLNYYTIVLAKMKISNMFCKSFFLFTNGAEPTPAPTPDYRSYNMRDPLKVATGQGYDLYEAAGNVRGSEPRELLSTDAIFSVIVRLIVIAAAGVILWSLITMLYISKTEKLAEKKKDIMHKLIIVFLTASSVTILNLIVYLVRGLV